MNHRVYRVTTATFWRKFHHEGKISPGWWGWDARPLPFTIFTITYITHAVVVYAPAERADSLPQFLFYPYMYSVVWTVPTMCPFNLYSLIFGVFGGRMRNEDLPESGVCGFPISSVSCPHFRTLPLSFLFCRLHHPSFFVKVLNNRLVCSQFLSERLI